MSTLLASFNISSASSPSGWVSLSGLGTSVTQNGITLTVDTPFSNQTGSSTLYNQDHYGVPEAVLENFATAVAGAGTSLRISGLSGGQLGFIRFGGGSANTGRHRLLTVDGITYQHNNPGGAAPITPEPPVDALFVADANGEVVFTLDAVTINAVFPYFQVFADTGPSITAADDITDETQPATVTLANNTAAPTAITINGTAATGITDEGAGVYSYTPPLIADDATATLAVTVDGETLTTTISYANSYPYELVTHGTPNANSIFSGTQFATNGPVEWGVVTDYNPAIVIVDHAAMDVAEDELNDVGLHSTEVAAGTTTATYKYFVPESGATGTFDSEITVAAAVVPQGAVTIGTITFDDTTASVPFTYSLSDQTGFEYSLDGGAWTPTTSPVSLSGLTEQTLYSISIRAVNATGSGTAATDTFTTAATPQVPQGVISVGTISLTDVSASVEFSYNAADQTGFEYRLGAGSYQAATSPIDIASLTPDTPYTGDIRAVNATGAGTPTSFEFTTLATFTPPAPSVPGLGRRGFLRSTVRGTVNSIVGGVSA